MINPVRLGAHFGMGIVIHTQIYIRFPILQLLSGYLQGMPTAFAEQFSPEQVEPMLVGSTLVAGTYRLHPFKLCIVYDRFMGIGCHNLPIYRNWVLPFRLIVCNFCL